jgi:hypothetical protein
MTVDELEEEGSGMSLSLCSDSDTVTPDWA